MPTNLQSGRLRACERADLQLGADDFQYRTWCLALLGCKPPVCLSDVKIGSSIPGARAARLLLDSLDDGDADPDAQRKRIDELIRRARAVRDGSAELIDGDEARRRVMARLSEIRGQ